MTAKTGAVSRMWTRMQTAVLCFRCDANDFLAKRIEDLIEFLQGRADALDDGTSRMEHKLFQIQMRDTWMTPATGKTASSSATSTAQDAARRTT